MIRVSVQSNIDAVVRKMRALQSQVPFATALALTRTAQDVKNALRDEMKQVFDRPTPYTLNSLRVKSATKQSLEALVWLKDDTFKGTPATKYLMPQIAGGARALKRFESSLVRAGLMPEGMVAVPGKAAKLDRYGNMRPSQITQMLSALRATSDATQHRRRGKVTRYFVGRPGNGPMGVWSRIGRALKPILIFVKAPTYQVRFNFAQLAKAVARARFTPNLEAALQRAMATAR